MKKRVILCDILIAINVLCFYLLAVWWFVGIALGTNYGDNSQEAIAEANRQSYICFATFLVLAGVSFYI